MSLPAGASASFPFEEEDESQIHGDAQGRGGVRRNAHRPARAKSRVGTHDDQPIWRERAVAWVEKSCTERVPVKLSDPLALASDRRDPHFARRVSGLGQCSGMTTDLNFGERRR